MMTTRFMVTQVKPCPKCKGQKIIQHPLWDEYWKFDAKTREAFGRIPTRDEESNFWASFGLYEFDKSIPPEEIECPDCGANGFIGEQVDLSVALKAYEEMGKCAADISDAPCTCGWH